eukprot:355005-Chlamydomonas_euryale.AAC.1
MVTVIVTAMVTSTGRHCEVATRDPGTLEYGPARAGTLQTFVRPQPGRRHNMPVGRSGYGQPNIHTRLADEDKSLFVTGTGRQPHADALARSHVWQAGVFV